MATVQNLRDYMIWQIKTLINSPPHPNSSHTLHPASILVASLGLWHPEPPHPKGLYKLPSPWLICEESAGILLPKGARRGLHTTSGSQSAGGPPTLRTPHGAFSLSSCMGKPGFLPCRSGKGSLALPEIPQTRKPTCWWIFNLSFLNLLSRPGWKER